MLTPDGYINHQYLTGSIQFGCLTSDENGCGWIAVFNVLRRLEGVSPDPLEIARLMSKGVILKGRLGTYIHGIVGFLRRRGYEVRWTFRKSAQTELAARADASIFLYCGLWSGLVLGHDVVRHTFFSMHVAAFKSVGEAAIEGGNTESVVKRHYLNLSSYTDGAQFWAIHPAQPG